MSLPRLTVRRAAAACLIAALSRLAVGKDNWTDRKEYDLVLNIRSENIPQKRLDLLDNWSKNYPKTQLREARFELYLATYEALGDRPRMFDTSRQILADDPNNSVGLYWCTLLLPQLPNPSPENMDAGEKAAQKLISGLNDYFSPDKKPASLAAPEWNTQKQSVELLAHKTLGWADWQRGNFADAEREFTTCIEKDPQNAEVASWLGIVLALQNGKQIPALWQLARASRVEGGAAPDDLHRQANAMLERVYASYHGALDGLDELKTASASKPFAPPEFSIDPATVVAARRAEAELSLTNPELASWMAMKRQLQAPDGDKFFTSALQSKSLPVLKGTVLRCTPPRAPREFALSMTDSSESDVVLRINASLPKTIAPGAKLSFQGTAESFNASPFMLTVVADSSQVSILQSAMPGSKGR